MKLLFSKTAGQARQKAFIQQSIENRAYPQALLVSGEKGLGQHAFITDVMEILLCSSETGRPCSKCSRCLERINRSRDNVITLFPLSEAQQKNQDMRTKSIMEKMDSFLQSPYRLSRSVREHVSIDQVREMKERLSYSELSSRNRIIMIYLAETMQAPAANALLKILEEPPRNTFFLLSCENRELLLPTILSRCVNLSMTRLSDMEMTAFIKENTREDYRDSGDLLIPFCGGSPGKFLELEENDGIKFLQLAHAYLHCLLNKDWQSLGRLIDNENAFENADSCLRILLLSLEVIRLYSTSQLVQGEFASAPVFQFSGNPDMDMSALVHRIGELDDVGAMVKSIEQCISSISRFSKPRIALLGNFFKLAALA